MRRSATLTMMIMLYFATILGTPLRAQDAATTESLVIAFIETLSPE